MPKEVERGQEILDERMAKAYLAEHVPMLSTAEDTRTAVEIARTHQETGSTALRGALQVEPVINRNRVDL